MKTILVVEDNSEYSDLLKKRLIKDGYAVTTAANGKIALDAIKKDHIDLLLLDLLMPAMDGVSFYYQLEHVLKKHIPIIVLTNMTDAAGFGQDVKEVLIKSNVSLDEVAAKIREYIG